MVSDIFKRYDSPEQYAEAFQQMIDARERWRDTFILSGLPETRAGIIHHKRKIK